MTFYDSSSMMEDSLWFENNYNKKGFIAEIKSFKKGQGKWWTYNYSYKDDLLIRIQDYWPGGGIWAYYTLHYDNSKHLIKHTNNIATDSTGIPPRSHDEYLNAILYHYDSNGKLVKSDIVNPNDSIESYTLYFYYYLNYAPNLNRT